MKEKMQKTKLTKMFFIFSIVLAVLVPVIFAFFSISVKNKSAKADIGNFVGRTIPSGATEVGTAAELIAALQDAEANDNTKNIVLTADIELDESQTFTGIFTSVSTTKGFKGTIYGQGHTLTLNGPNVGNGAGETTASNACGFTAKPGNTAWGGVVGNLGYGGAIYDLNLKFSGRVAYGPTDGAQDVYLGVIVGQMSPGSSIENCSVTLNANSELYAFCWESSTRDAFPSAGGIAGRMYAGATIQNCLVENNGVIKGAQGITDINNGTSYGTTQEGAAGNIVGYIINNGATTINNIITSGAGKVFGRSATNIGMTYTGTGTSTAITVQNFYSTFSGTYEYGTYGASSNPGVSYGLFRFYTSEDSSITNFYRSSNMNTANNSTYAATVSNLVTTDGYSLDFNPTTTDLANSLVVKANSASADLALPTLTDRDGHSYSGYLDEAGMAVFENLPTAASHYSNSGTFDVEISLTPITQARALNRFDAGYVSTQTNQGVAISSESQLREVVSGNQTGYLTKDILLTSFSTATFSGTIDGNGHTIYIMGDSSNASGSAGSIAGILSGTIKNLRVVLYGTHTLTATGTYRAGLVCGQIRNGTIENVYVLLNSGASFNVRTGTGGTVSAGAVTGFVGEANATLTDVTVENNGTIDAQGGYVFISMFVGANQGNQTINATNLIMKGNGTLSGDGANSDPGEQSFYGGFVILQAYKSGSSYPRATINITGFVNNFTGSITNSGTSGTDKPTMYGIISINDAHDFWAHGENDQVQVTGYAEIGQVTEEFQMQDGYLNNTFVELLPHTISEQVLGTSVSVTPYFEAGDLLLVAGDGTANYWQSGVGAAIGADNGVQTTFADSITTSQNVDNYKTLSLPNHFAQAAGTIRVEPYYKVSDPSLTGQYIYTAAEQSASISMTMGDSALSNSDYMVEYDPDEGTGAALGESLLPLNAGTYTLTITLTRPNLYFSDMSKTKSLQMVMSQAEATINVELTENAQITYGDSYKNVQNLISVSHEGFLQGVAFEVTPLVGSESYTTASPANGVVSFDVAATADDGNSNYNITINNNSSLTIQKAIVALTQTTFTRPFGEISQTNLSQIFGDIISGEKNRETASYVLEVSSAAYSDDGYLKVNETGYVASITLPSDGNYAFADAQSLTIVVTSTLQSQTQISFKYGALNVTNHQQLLLESIREALTLDETQQITLSEQTFDYSTSKSLKAGSYSILATVDDSGEYTTVNFKVTKVQIQISISQQLSKTYDAEAVTLPSLSSSQILPKDQVMLALQSQDVILNAGIYDLTLSTTGADLANYEITLAEAYQYQVSKATLTLVTQTLSFEYGALTSENWQQQMQDLIELNGVADEVISNFVLSSDQISTQSGNLNAGDYQISITASNLTNYEDFAGSFAVNIQKATVTIDALSPITYGELRTEGFSTYIASLNLVKTTGGSSVAYTAECEAITSSAFDYVQANEEGYLITILFDENYTCEDNTLNLIVNKRSVTVTVSAQDFVITYGDDAAIVNQKLSASVSAGDFLTQESLVVTAVVDAQPYTSESPAGSTVTASLEVVLENDALSNYDLTIKNSISATIQKRQIELSRTHMTATYGDHNLTQENLDDYIQSLDLATQSYSAICRGLQFSESGNLNASELAYEFVIALENANYQLTSNVFSLTVQKAELTLACDTTQTLSFEYGALTSENWQQQMQDLIELNGVADEVISNFVLSSDQISTQSGNLNAGDYQISITASNLTNYEDFAGSFAVNIQKATVTIDALSPITYGELRTEGFSTYIASLNLVKTTGGSSVAYTAECEAITSSAFDYVQANEEGYLITILFDENYTCEDNTLNLIVNKRSVTVTVSAQDFVITYGDDAAIVNQKLSASVSAGDFLTQESLVVTAVVDAQPYTSESPAGSTVTASLEVVLENDALSNYDLTIKNSISATIQKRQIELSRTHMTATYGDHNLTQENLDDYIQSLDLATQSYSAICRGLQFSESGNLNASELAYEFVIALENANYQLTSNVFSLTVQKAELTLACDTTQTYVYGSEGATKQMIEQFIQQSISGVVSGDAATVVINSESLSDGYMPADAYAVSFSVSNQQNYQDFSSTITFNITKRPIEVTLVSNSQQFTGDEILPEIIQPTLVGDDQVELSLSSETIMGVGVYTLSLVVSGVDADNYDFTLQNDQFEVTRAELVFNDELQDVTILPDGDVMVAELSIMPSDQGFANAEQIVQTLQNLNILQNAAGEAISFSVTAQAVHFTAGGRLSAGTAVYRAEVVDSANYNISTFEIRLTVEKIEISIFFENNFVYSGNKIQLSPQVSGQVFEGDDVSFNLITDELLNAGVYSVVLSVEGSDQNSYNFVLASDSITIAPAPVTIALSQQNVTLENFVAFGTDAGEFDPLSIVSSISSDNQSLDTNSGDVTYEIVGLGEEIEYNKTYEVRITAQGNYSGQASYNLTILPPDAQQPELDEIDMMIIDIVIALGALIAIGIGIRIISIYKKDKTFTAKKR